ncbi:MAG: TIGR04255 family protein [Mycobacteriales bacterium]
MSEQAVYSNAPVVLVAFEVRHPTTNTLTSIERSAIKESLSRWVPIQRSAKHLEFQAVMGSATQPEALSEEFPKYFSRDSMLAVSFRKEAIVVETTRYEGWQALQALVRSALQARNTVAHLDGIERVGLRYINEIRVPKGGEVDWSAWVDTSILGPHSLGSKIGMPVSQWQGIGVYGNQPGQALVLRYGPREGYVVDDNPELRRVPPKAGAFMWLDIDSFWLPEDITPEFDVDRIDSLSNELHEPVHALFETLITDRLRDEVLRGA